MGWSPKPTIVCLRVYNCANVSTFVYKYQLPLAVNFSISNVDNFDENLLFRLLISSNFRGFIC